jgi:hypothetical protein
VHRSVPRFRNELFSHLACTAVQSRNRRPSISPRLGLPVAVVGRTFSGFFFILIGTMIVLSNILCMYDHFSPAGVKLNTLLKPTILHLHSIFVLDVDGQLHEHAKVNIFTAPVFYAYQSDVWSRLMRSGCGTATRIIRLNGQGALMVSLLSPYRSPQLLQHGRRCPLALVFPRIQRGTTVCAVAVLAIVVTSICAGTSVTGTARSGQSPLPCPYCLALHVSRNSPLCRC